MLTEDDTYRKLAQLPYEEMLARARQFLVDYNLESDNPALAKYLEGFHWTEKELSAEWMRRNHPD